MNVYGNTRAERPGLTKQTSIWRYRPIERFIEEITSGDTYLRRSDKLDDQVEGALMPVEARGLSALTRGASSNELFGQDRKRTYIQCWQIADFEDVAMWERYTGKSGGVAITTSVQKLRDHYYVHLKSSDVFDSYIRATFVDYIDAENHFDLFESLSMEKFLRKRREYQAEREFRVIYQLTPKIPNGDGTSEYDHDFHFESGVFLKIDHASMIDRFVLSPGLPASA